MKNITRAIFLSLTLLVTLFAAGCPERKSIADIEANPAKYQNKEVVIVGVVRDSYGISIPGTRIGGGAYKIDDGTGAIWVFTEGTVPSKGSEIGVQGIVGSGVNWRRRNYGLGMYEKKRRYAKR